jgi:predicted dehydrogenase
MKEIRIGVIGTGNIGRTHLESIAAAQGARVTAICDKQPHVADEAAEIFHIDKKFYSIDDLVECPDVDAVVLAVPNYVHEEGCLKAAKNGKHVFCEKPMTMTVRQAENMTETCHKYGVTLQMGFCNRFLGESEVLREYIESGLLGDMYYAHTDILRQRGAPVGWFTNKAKSGGGPLIDVGVHMIDLAWFLMGRPKPVAAKALMYDKIPNKYPKGVELYCAYEKDDVFNVEDNSFGMITFENGAGLSYQAAWNYNGTSNDMGLNLQGTKGGAEIMPLKIFKEELGYLTEVKPPLPEGDCYVRQIEHFARAIQGLEPLRTPGEDGVTVQRMLCGLYESARTGKEVKL